MAASTLRRQIFRDARTQRKLEALYPWLRMVECGSEDPREPPLRSEKARILEYLDIFERSLPVEDAEWRYYETAEQELAPPITEAQAKQTPGNIKSRIHHFKARIAACSKGARCASHWCLNCRKIAGYKQFTHAISYICDDGAESETKRDDLVFITTLHELIIPRPQVIFPDGQKTPAFLLEADRVSDPAADIMRGLHSDKQKKRKRARGVLQRGQFRSLPYGYSAIDKVFERDSIKHMPEEYIFHDDIDTLSRDGYLDPKDKYDLARSLPATRKSYGHLDFSQLPQYLTLARPIRAGINKGRSAFNRLKKQFPKLGITGAFELELIDLTVVSNDKHRASPKGRTIQALAQQSAKLMEKSRRLEALDIENAPPQLKSKRYRAEYEHKLYSLIAKADSSELKKQKVRIGILLHFHGVIYLNGYDRLDVEKFLSGAKNGSTRRYRGQFPIPLQVNVKSLYAAQSVDVALVNTIGYPYKPQWVFNYEVQGGTDSKGPENPNRIPPRDVGLLAFLYEELGAKALNVRITPNEEQLESLTPIAKAKPKRSKARVPTLEEYLVFTKGCTSPYTKWTRRTLTASSEPMECPFPGRGPLEPHWLDVLSTEHPQ